MPIHVPGKRDHRNRRLTGGKRSAVAVLQLTAMVDMFTVLAVFLLQNYATTDQILFLPEKVQLPQAKAIRELKPSNVVIIAKDGIYLNNEVVADYLQVKEQEDWDVEALKKRVEELIVEGKKEAQAISQRIKTANPQQPQNDEPEDEIASFRKMTIQADKTIDFLTVKKIMYSVTEAGVFEINFAVLERRDET